MAKINAQKLEEFFFKTLSLYKSLEPYKEVYDKVSTPIDTAFKNYEKAIKGDIISSDNDDINKLWALAKVWKNVLDTMTRKDENYWMDRSGVNMLDKASIPIAVNKLKDLQHNLKLISAASDACHQLIWAMNVSDHIDIKGVAESLLSTKALDIEARRQALKEFKDCISMVDRILPALNNALFYFEKVR